MSRATISPEIGPLLELLIIPLLVTLLSIVIRWREQTYSGGLDILVAKSIFDVAVFIRADTWAPIVSPRFKPVFPNIYVALCFASLILFGLLIPKEAALQKFRMAPVGGATRLQRLLRALNLLWLLFVCWGTIVAMLSINIAVVALR